MFYRVVVPLLVLAILVLVVFALVLWQRRRDTSISREERLAAEKRWSGNCEFDNPKTGAKCEREEFHLNHHYHDVDGELVWW